MTTVQNRTLVDKSGTVKENVGLKRFAAGKRINRSPVRHIQRFYLAACLRTARQRRNINIGCEHARALIGKGQCGGLADARTRSGYQCRLSL